MQRLAAHTVLGLIVLATAACGDDKKKDRDELMADGSIVDPDDELPSGDAGVDGAIGNIDGGVSIDAALPDGAIAVDAGDAAADAASADAAAGDGGCDLDDPRFGCGRVSQNDDWVRFDNGLEIDRETGLGWSPTLSGVTDDELVSICDQLSLSGLADFRIPEIRDVRTLAAGCPQTLPEGVCQVQTGAQPRASTGCGPCNPAVNAPPHASGSYCRPEVPDCALLWTLTHCGPNDSDCPTHEHWFYIPSTGAVELHGYGTPVATSARGRCVARAPEPLP